MKAILSMALVFGVCGLADAADEKVVDPVGTWQCSYEIGEQKRTSTLRVKKEGDTFVGTMSWADQKDEKIKDPKFKDGTLTFSAERKFMGNTIPIDYTLTIDGDKLKGKGASEFGGQERTVAWTASSILRRNHQDCSTTTCPSCHACPQCRTPVFGPRTPTLPSP